MEECLLKVIGKALLQPSDLMMLSASCPAVPAVYCVCVCVSLYGLSVRFLPRCEDSVYLFSECVCPPCVCVCPVRVCVHSSLHCPTADMNGSFVCVPGKSRITGSLWWMAAFLFLFSVVRESSCFFFFNRPFICNLKGISEDARFRFFGCVFRPLSLYPSRLSDEAFLSARCLWWHYATPSHRRLNTM